MVKTWISLAGLVTTLAMPITPAAADSTRSTNCVYRPRVSLLRHALAAL